MRFFSSPPPPPPPPQLSPLPLPDSGFLSFHIFICRQRFTPASLLRFFFVSFTLLPFPRHRRLRSLTRLSSGVSRHNTRWHLIIHGSVCETQAVQIFRRSGRTAVRAPACLLPPPSPPLSTSCSHRAMTSPWEKKKKACVRPPGIKVGCIVDNKLALFTSPFPNAKVRL